MSTASHRGISNRLDLMEIIQRSARPKPWAEGEKIPWNDPEFSLRMLREHLSQEHDWASRRAVTIQKHVGWIHREILSGQPGRILDLGCGPGLYAIQLAKLGHECVGVDFSPASIEYARKFAQKEHLRCSYFLQDVREALLGLDYDLAMFIFGEFNVFKPEDARQILIKTCASIRPGGALLLEAHTFDAVKEIGLQPSSWYSANSGLFSDRPHLYLQENFWDEHPSVATQRYFIVDGMTNQVTRYASSMQAYTQEQYQCMLEECGFHDIVFHPSLMGEIDPSQSALIVIRAHK